MSGAGEAAKPLTDDQKLKKVDEMIRHLQRNSLPMAMAGIAPPHVVSSLVELLTAIAGDYRHKIEVRDIEARLNHQ